MTQGEAIHKLEYLKKAYQMLIDEKVDRGKLVGRDITGEWKADSPLDEAYKSMIEALDVAIKDLEHRDCENCIHSDKGKCAYTEICHECMWESKFEQQPCEDCISRQKALDCFEQTNTRQGAKYAIETLPSVTPQRPKGKWIYENEKPIIEADKGD